MAWVHGQGLSTQTAGDVLGVPASLAKIVDRVISDGKAEYLPHLGAADAPEPRNGNVTSAPQDLTTSLVVPLQVRDRVLGVLTLAMGASGRRFQPADLALVGDLAQRAAIALDNARLYEEAQESDRRKNEFLAMLAHELRNPLAPIRSAVQIMGLIGPDLPDLKWARNVMDRQ